MKQILIILLIAVSSTMSCAAQSDSSLIKEYNQWIDGSKLAVYEMKLLMIEDFKAIRQECLWTLRFRKAHRLKLLIRQYQAEADSMLKCIDEKNFREPRIIKNVTNERLL